MVVMLEDPQTFTTHHRTFRMAVDTLGVALATRCTNRPSLKQPWQHLVDRVLTHVAFRAQDAQQVSKAPPRQYVRKLISLVGSLRYTCPIRTNWVKWLLMR